MKRYLIPFLAAAAAILGTGCSATRDASPTCTAAQVAPLVLASQAVPTASLVPCLAAYPGGWTLGPVDVHQGQASFTLNSDQGGARAMKVTLTRACDTTDAIEVPTDQPGTTRFDSMPIVDKGFDGFRSYRFDGGCVTFHFSVRANRAGALVDEASLAVRFVPRADVLARYEAQS